MPKPLNLGCYTVLHGKSIILDVRQGENRVTSTLMAVLENINNQLTEDLLEAVLDESDLVLVTFENQFVGDGSVSDAGVRSSISLLAEKKRG